MPAERCAHAHGLSRSVSETLTIVACMLQVDPRPAPASHHPTSSAGTSGVASSAVDEDEQFCLRLLAYLVAQLPGLDQAMLAAGLLPRGSVVAAVVAKAGRGAGFASVQLEPLLCTNQVGALQGLPGSRCCYC